MIGTAQTPGSHPATVGGIEAYRYGADWFEDAVLDDGAHVHLRFVRPEDKELLARFPEGYRHLAYLQTRIGYTVKPDMPGLDGPDVEALYARGERWLRGETL